MDDHARVLRDAQRVLQSYGIDADGDLRSLRAALERLMFDEDERCRDDIAEIAMKIDDLLDYAE
jgi:ElaB/YqjD/DUF883 family membrane-anchored ribosome-binding protein